LKGFAMVRSVVPLFAVALAASAPALATELVMVPHFDSIELRGGGSVVVVPGPAERVTIVEGSTRFTHIAVDRNRKLKIDICDGDCPRNYRLRVQIQSPRVPVLAIEGGGAINVAPGFGPQHQLVAAVNGGGTIDTRAVNVADVTAAVNGGGALLVRAASSLTGAIHGGGVVRYWGNPQVTSAIDGGGSVRPGY
jgi:Putative auto-transporter adhesin, head GIN domain